MQWVLLLCCPGIKGNEAEPSPGARTTKIKGEEVLSWAGLIEADLAGPGHPKSLQESSGCRDKMRQVEAWLVVQQLWLNVQFGGAVFSKQQGDGTKGERSGMWCAP